MMNAMYCEYVIRGTGYMCNEMMKVLAEFSAVQSKHPFNQVLILVKL